MTTPRTLRAKKKQSDQFSLNPSYLYKLIHDVLFDSKYSFYVMCLLIPVEIFLNLFIVMKIKCKNIYKIILCLLCLVS